MTLPTQTMENTIVNFTPSFKNTDDMPEYVSIYELRKPRGRPKGSCKLSDEERREKARLKSKTYYDRDPEKERERKRLEHARKLENAKER